MVKRFSVLAMVVCFIVTLPAMASPLDRAEARAVEYVTAFQKGEWARAEALASDAALSWVEYVGARDAKTDGILTTDRVESAAIGESVRAKVYYTNSEGQIRVRYLKLKQVSGDYFVVDDRMLGRDWVSLSYRKGLFPTPQEIDGVRITVVGLLEVQPEIKIDFVIENSPTGRERLVLPSLEAFYVVDADGQVKKKYFANPPQVVPEKPVGPGQKIRSYAIMPYWHVDPVFQGKAWKKVGWVLYIPFGPVDQFAFDYM